MKNLVKVVGAIMENEDNFFLKVTLVFYSDSKNVLAAGDSDTLFK